MSQKQLHVGAAYLRLQGVRVVSVQYVYVPAVRSEQGFLQRYRSKNRFPRELLNNRFDFFPTAKCPPGQYSETGLAPCSTCPANFYQTASGQTVCTECPTNMRTKGAGAANRDECQSIVCTESSCLHGGLCMPLGHGIQCFCPAGFSGKRCEIDIDECASQPCYNGGSCTDLPQGYRCQCKNGFSGINCQEEKTDCRNDTCPERAMCKDEPGMNNFTCLCRSGYTGKNCDMTVSRSMLIFGNKNKVTLDGVWRVERTTAICLLARNWD